MLSTSLTFGAIFSLFITTTALPSRRTTDSISKNADEHSIVSSTVDPKRPNVHSLNTDFNASTFTLANDTTSLSYSPSCFLPPPAGAEPYPIGNLRDCLEAITKIMSVPHPFKICRWGISMSWIYDTCLVSLHHISSNDEAFSSATIAHEAMRVNVQCMTPEHMYRGGLVRIGSGSNYMVAVGWRGITQLADSVQVLPANKAISR
ncbi:hypothetical protein N7G274_010407 [Stereocaulon virgatum]|uniref:Uncharacterized protein n=1 Tax=Stereocaulon virgatum TaxID=373712 RepID=A0ABR3ZUP5_9LECA